MTKCECKNCVHEKVCRIREFPSIYEILKDGCDHYKDKSLIVELPCRCKDCEYSREIKLEQETIYKCIAEIPHRLVTADDFCQYAEVKEIEDESIQSRKSSRGTRNLARF